MTDEYRGAPPRDPGLAGAWPEGLDGPVDEAEGEGPDEAPAELRVGQVAPAEHGERLDRWLARLAPEFSRSHVQTLIAQGEATIDGRPATTPAKRLLAGQQLALRLVPTPQSQAFRPEPLPLAVVHEDESLMVVDKPVGRVVHPAAGHWSGTLLNGLLAHHAGASALPRAGIVHRLDKDTSGLMVVAKTLAAQTALVRAIAAREVHREYLALAHGLPPPTGTIDAPIGRDPASRVRMAVVAGGKPARTDIERLGGVAEAGPRGVSLLRCLLHSGRTHQIRVHLAHRGHPLLADAVYGGAPAAGLQRQALHARVLSLVHPLSGRRLRCVAPPPTDLLAAVTALGLQAALPADPPGVHWEAS